MEKIKSRRTRSLTVRDLAEQQKRAKELEDELKKDQRRQEIKNRREKVKNIGRKIRKKDKPKGIPKDLKPGDCVLIKHGIGIVRYIGTVEGAKRKDQIYAGIELKDVKARGLNDGSAFGIKYFECEEKHGVFVRNVPKVLPSETLLSKLGKLNTDLKKSSFEQIKLHEEVLRIDQENEELLQRYQAEKERADRAEEELLTKSKTGNAPSTESKTAGPNAVTPSSRKSVAQDDEKLPTIADGKKYDQPSSVRSSTRIQKVNENLERKKKALFRVASGDLWSENDVLDYEKQLQQELDKSQREAALMALDLPDFNAPDGDFINWLTQRFQQFRKLDSQFSVPDIKEPKVKRAILVVTRMLASFTQQMSRNQASYKSLPKSLLSGLDTRNDNEDSFSSSSEVSSSEDDF